MARSQFDEFNLDPALAEAVQAASEHQIIEGILRLEDPLQVPAEFRLISQFIRICTGRFLASDTWTIRRHPNVVSLKAARTLGISQCSGQPSHDFAAERQRYSPLAYTGRGVTIAMLDFGVDFGHPNFLNADGATRLSAFWHQGAAYDPTHPNRYGYGRVFSRQEIDAALQTPNPYQSLGYHPAISDTGHGSHGTHTMDIAAGNGRAANSLRGVAPDADLLFVHLSTPHLGSLGNLGDSVRMLEALDFADKTAGDRPCVVNLSVGRTAGSHDGSSPFEQGMHELLRKRTGRAIAQSAGNYRAAHLAVNGWVRDGEHRELEWSIDPRDTMANEIDAWYSGNDRFFVTLSSPSNLARVEVRLGEVADLRLDGALIGRVYHRKSDPNNNDNHIAVFLYPNAPSGTWTLGLFGDYVINGRFHAWIERESSGPGKQSRFDEKITSPLYTLGTIATSPLVLTTGAYDANLEGAPLAAFSSCGPTRDDRRDKPELLAPGVKVVAARSIPLGVPRQEGLLVSLSGTSMAAPHVTGTVAAMFEAAGRPLSIEEVRHCLHTTATTSTVLPADCCAWGRLDIVAAIAAAEKLRELAPVGQPPVEDAEVGFDGARYLDGAEHAMRCAYGRRGDSEVLFIERLLRELSDSSRDSKASPIALFRAAVGGEGISRFAGNSLEVIGLAARPPDRHLRPGDWMLRVAPGTGDVGHLAVLVSRSLMSSSALAAAGIAAESRRPGYYGIVVEAGAFPRSRSRPFARRLLDNRGCVPAFTAFLRPKYPGVVVAANTPTPPATACAENADL